MYLCFAGVEDKRKRDLMKRIRQKHILMSYFYLRGRVKNRMSEFIEELADFDTVLIDSGAFTFMNSGTPFKGIEGNSPEAFAKRKAITEKYTYEYAEFLSQIKDHITGAFEMDYDLGFGSEQCWKWTMYSSSGARVLLFIMGCLR